MVIILASLVEKLGPLVDLTDLLFLSMALPNLIGLYILQGDVKNDLKEYTRKLKNGALEEERIKKEDK